MPKYMRYVYYIFFAFVISMFPVTLLQANAAEPPCFTIVVSNPPSDLSLSLHLKDNQQLQIINPREEEKAWEIYYKFFYSMGLSHQTDFENIVLDIQSSEKSFQCSLPPSTFKTYNNILTLDLKHEKLTMGHSILRTTLLILLRLVLTLLIEGIIFYLFGYRNKRSWISFLAINLITQGGLNFILSTSYLGYTWLFFFIFCELIILVIELITLTHFVKEHEKSRMIVYVITANLLSLILGGMLISNLPI